MTYEEYDDLPGVRWTNLRRMCTSALHYIASRKYESSDTAPLRLGRAVHCAILEPDEFSARWVCWTGPTRRGKAWNEFRAEHSGREILSTREMQLVVGMAAAVRRHKAAVRYLDGAAEHTVTWLDQETGLRCKARADLVSPPRHLELKSTMRLDDRQFAYTAANLRYHCGLAFHHDGLVASGLELEPEPLIIAVETAYPWDVVVFQLAEAAMQAGRREYRRLLLKVAECTARGEWPGRSPSDVIPLDLPEWAYRDPDADPFGLELDGERVF